MHGFRNTVTKHLRLGGQNSRAGAQRQARFSGELSRCCWLLGLQACGCRLCPLGHLAAFLAPVCRFPVLMKAPIIFSHGPTIDDSTLAPAPPWPGCPRSSEDDVTPSPLCGNFLGEPSASIPLRGHAAGVPDDEVCDCRVRAVTGWKPQPLGGQRSTRRCSSLATQQV